MIETFAALALAHAIADFLFQNKAMIARKRELPVLAGHVAIVALTA